MSLLQAAFLILAILATILFVYGYVRGARAALATYADDTVETDDHGDVDAYWWQIGLAVLSSAVVIALAGISPVFIYLGPLLAIVTAGMVGVAFLVDRRGRV